MLAMKVAVSVPDSVFDAAERAAKRLSIARSQLYTRALEAYLKEEPRPDVTKQLNSVYGSKGEQGRPGGGRVQPPRAVAVPLPRREQRRAIPMVAESNCHHAD